MKTSKTTKPSTKMLDYVTAKILNGGVFDETSMGVYLTRLSAYLKGRKGYSDHYVTRQKTAIMNLFRSGHFNSIMNAPAA